MFKSREDAIAYAKKHNVPVVQTEKSIYSRDANLWHISHEGGTLEDPAKEPLPDTYTMTVDPLKAPDTPEAVKIDFEQGVPVAVNDVRMSPATIVETLNQLGGKHGVGRIDLVENRLVGMKSRGVYETPGGTILYKAHAGLESICLDRDTVHYKEQLAVRYGELVYNGQWYSTLRESMQAFIAHTQKNMTGSATVKMYKGSVTLIGRTSKNSLYSEAFATFGEDDVYDQTDAIGFINLLGLPLKMQATMELSQTGKSKVADLSKRVTSA